MLFLLACGPVSISLGDSTNKASQLDTVPAAPEVDVPEPDADKLFSLDQVHVIEVSLERAAETSLRNSPYDWVEGDVTVDGQLFSHAGLRIKGRLGSLRSFDAKCGLKIDFGQFGSAAKLEGMKKIGLGNMVQDNSQVNQFAAYAIYRAMGVPAPRMGYAWVTVNGEDYGLYALVEDYDDVFLKGWYADNSGNLYDGDYKLWPDGSYTLLDFQNGVDDLFELDEGADVGLSDLKAITAVLDAGGDVSALVDTDLLARMWAVDAWIGHYDSYSYNINNFRVYFDPADGKADLFPWDPDWAFYTDTPVTNPSGRLSAICKNDTACHARFLSALSEISAQVEADDIPAKTQAAIDLITPYVSQDPRRELDLNTVSASQDFLRRWLDRRDEALAGMQGL